MFLTEIWFTLECLTEFISYSNNNQCTLCSK